MPVVSNLLSKELSGNFIAEVRAENERTRGYHKADRAKGNYLTIEEARKNAFDPSLTLPNGEGMADAYPVVRPKTFLIKILLMIIY